jgi:hexosaminidase
MLLVALFVASVVGWSVIPRPQSISFPGGAPLLICKDSLSITGSGGDILKQGIARFYTTVFSGSAPTSCPAKIAVAITLQSQSETLDSGTLENYTLALNAQGGAIVSANVFGALHALETLAQLVDRSAGTVWTVPQVSVVDAPRFSFRGFLHDSSRHYLPWGTLCQLIDALASAKYNVFHWHIVDDQSFPYVSEVLPKLSLGSYGGKTSLTYTPQVVQAVISYAKYRGVRVIPEFDTPGHCASWGVGYPEIVTQCYSKGAPDGTTGPMNPTLNSTFEILAQVGDANRFWFLCCF